MDAQRKKSKQESLTKFLVKEYEEEFLGVLESSDQEKSYKIDVDFPILTRATGMNNWNAEFFYEILPASVQDAQKKMLEKYTEIRNNLTIKEKLTARIVSIPGPCDFYSAYPSVEHINKMVWFNGTVTKVLGSRAIESCRIYVCNQCGYEVTTKIDYTLEEFFDKPSKCTKIDCPSTRFSFKETNTGSKKYLKDYQEIKLQEKLDIYSAGNVPKSIIAILENDLVDACKPGDDVTIVYIEAVVVLRYGRFIEGQRGNSELIFHVNSLKVNNDDLNQIHITAEKIRFFESFWESYKSRPLMARNIILSSLCPKLYGMYIVKLAVCLVIAGGVSRRDQSGTRVRGESHLMLAGDPGTGKSQFLKYTNRLIPKSVLTNGIGNSSAGLTATASREGGLWHLEAGALVLADGGICCVDEFNCMKETEKSSMLEAMEQQSISVAKAGIVCTLRTQCSVLAACNPKGKYDHNQPATINLAMSSPLLSRFDLIFLLLDTPNEQWDNLAATFLLEGIDLLRGNFDLRKMLWDFEQLQLYLNHIRTLEPQLTPDANSVIIKYYQMQRIADERNAARTTVRMLESIIRLSQAHAKLMFREQVLVMDTIVAITLMECSLNKTSFFGSVNILHTSFPEDPEVEYSNQAKLILERLELDELLATELEHIKTNFEPFNGESRSMVNRTANISGHNFDIISQMISNVPTQPQQNTSIYQPPSTSSLFNRSLNLSTNRMAATNNNTTLVSGNKRKLDDIEKENDKEVQEKEPSRIRFNTTLNQTRYFEVKSQSQIQSQNRRPEASQTVDRSLVEISANNSIDSSMRKRNRVEEETKSNSDNLNQTKMSSQRSSQVNLSSQQIKKTQQPVLSVSSLDFDLEDLKNDDCDI